jgi:hypothetical protein
MGFGLISVDQDTEWDSIVSNACVPDPHYRNFHSAMYAAPMNGTPYLYHYESEGRIFIYPFVLLHEHQYINGAPQIQIETAYGYGGPFSQCKSLEFLQEAWRGFAVATRSINFDREFIRYSPFIVIEDHRDGLNISRNRPIALVFRNQEDHIDSISQKSRNMVTRALRTGCVFRAISNIRDYSNFIDIYLANMRHIAARPFFYYEDDYFKLLWDAFDYRRIYGVFSGSKLVAGAVFYIEPGKSAAYHLGAQTQDLVCPGLMNLCLVYSINSLLAEGIPMINMTGGRSPDTNDSLFKFKSSVSNASAYFYIGERLRVGQI